MGNLFSNIYCQSNNSSNKSSMSSTINIDTDTDNDIVMEKISNISHKRYFTEDDYMNHGVLFQRLYRSIVLEYYTDL